MFLQSLRTLKIHEISSGCYVVCRIYLFDIMSFNVHNNWRSSPPFKTNRRFAVGWNVGERKPHKA